MTGNSAHGAGILIVNFALNNSLSVVLVNLRRRNAVVPFWPGPEARGVHAGLRKNGANKQIERLAGNAFQRRTQDDESYVAILRPSARLGGELNRARSLNHGVFAAGALEQLNVPGQTRAVLQKVSNRYASTVIICTGRQTLRDEIRHRRF